MVSGMMFSMLLLKVAYGSRLGKGFRVLFFGQFDALHSEISHSENMKRALRVFTNLIIKLRY